MNSNRLQTLYLKISRDRYHFLKFILEGYDGLAILSAAEDNIVLLRYPCELGEDLLHLLASISREIRPADGD